jgi:antitoxin MazE
LGYTHVGKEMTIVVNKWGNSLGVRIPLPVANEVGFTVGTLVSMEVMDGKIIISPVQKKYQLDELLDGVTPELIGGEYDWGKPVGREVW